MRIYLLFCLLLLGSFWNLPTSGATEEQKSTDVYNYLLDLDWNELSEVCLQSSGLFPMDWDKAPGIYYVISKDRFDQYGFRSLEEYLSRFLPGVHTANHGNQGATIGVRGILLDTNSKTLLLRDNINLNTRNLVGINGSQLSTPLLGDIDRIEVSLGPGSLRHGSGAINGYINLISATGKTKEGLRTNMSYGSGESRLFEASYGWVGSDSFNLFLYGGYSKANGVAPHYTLSPDQWNGLPGVTGTPSSTFLDNVTVGKTDDDYKFSFRAQFGQKDDFFNLDLKGALSRTTNVDPVLGEYLDPSGSWSLEIQRASEVQGGRYSPFFMEYDEKLVLSPELLFNFNGNHTLTIIPFYLDNRAGNEFSDELNDWIHELGITPNPTDCPLYGCQDDYPNNGWETHTGLTFIHSYHGLENQEIGWGGEYKHSSFHFFPTDWDTLSLFAEDQVAWNDFSFLFGLRYDKVDYDNSFVTFQPAPYDTGPYSTPGSIDALTKRVAVSYAINPKDTVKFSYQEGFRFADKLPQHWTAYRVKAGAPNSATISPEESQSFELNYSTRGWLQEQLSLNASLFYTVYEKTHGWDNDNYTFANSPNDITSYGSEISADYLTKKGVNIGLSYSFAQPHDSYETSIQVANADDTWTRYPVHMFKFHLGWQATDKLFFGSAGAYESPRYNKATTPDRVTDLFDDWDFTLDTVLSYQWTPHWRLTVTAKEILTHNYNQKTAYFQGTRPLDNPRPEDPQYYVSLSYSF